MKKIPFIPALIGTMAVALAFAATALAATPTLSLTSSSDGNSVQLNATGDPNVSVLLFYTKTNVGSQVTALGNTDSTGAMSTSISSSSFGIAAGSSVYIRTNGVGGPQSATVAWPSSSANGVFSLNPTGLVLAVGQSSTITAANTGGNSLYLSNNSNPPVANVNINGSQITVTAISNGQTVVMICTQGSSSSCASAYVTVQAGATQALSFSMSNVTVAPGQSLPITISGGSGNYSVLNNSNSTAIQTSISGSTVTLSTTATSGSAAITICSSDMQTCGIINATAGSTGTVALSFNPSSPIISVGQSVNVIISGGTSSSYYVSSNSNQTAVGTNVSGNNITLTGINNGLANLTICSGSGSCGTLAVTVSYVASGGTLQLSQNTAVMLVGQVLSITVSGGTSPYTLYAGSGNIFQASLNGNVVTLSAIAAGSSTLNVCSAGGACSILSVTVNASGAGTPLTFSQNNLSLSVGNVTALTISGNGGYYISTSANPNTASAQINGNTALVTALAAGSNNISICQSGGQCAILFVTVTSGASTVAVPTFSQNNPAVAAGQVITETISGGTSSNYYILTNTNPAAVQLSLNANQLTLTGLTSGLSSVAVCAAANSCAVLAVTVNGTALSTVYFTTTSLPVGTVGQAYSNQLAAAGGSGNYTFALTAGALPSGLTLSAGGLLSGTPNAAANNTLTITVTDNAGKSANANFTLAINTALTAPTTPPATTNSYANGQIINENGTLYIVFQNTKVGFANAAAFLGLGFKFSNATAVSNSGLTVSNKVVITADGAHPRGSWIASGNTVYFVVPTGLIPVPDWAKFLSNGGQASFIVKANAYDLARPILPLMAANDSRMHQ